MSAYFPPDPKPKAKPARAPTVVQKADAAEKTFLVRFPWFTPSHVLLTVAVVGLVAILALKEFNPHAAPSYASVGHRYHVELGKVYAHAYLAGADNLDSGADPSAAIDGVAKSLDAGRVSAYEQIVTPEFVKAMPEGKSDKDVTPEERRALAAAWRAFAKGMGAGR